MLNLSGFASIAHLGLTALENNPHEVVAIIETVIQDADQARDLVLGRDRSTGGSPSQKLIDFAHNSPTATSVREKDTDHEEEIFYLEEENEQPPIEDVLSDVVTDADELINFALEDKETHTNSPSLDEVFGNQEDEFAMIESLDDTEENQDESEIPSLEDIFTSEISQEEINLLSKASDMALEEDKNITIPSLEDVFTAPEFDNIDISPQEEEEESPSLDDVFGEKITFSTIENDNSPENEDTSSIPTIEELIGDVVKDSKKTITPESFIPVEREEKTYEDNEETPATGANIEQQIESLQNVFDKLPGLKEEADINQFVRGKKSQPKQKKQPITPQVTPSVPKPKSNLTVRVDLERLERMNNLIGELSINRNGLSLQNYRLQTSVKDLLERFSRFQSTANALRELSDKMLTSPEKFNVPQVILLSLSVFLRMGVWT